MQPFLKEFAEILYSGHPEGLKNITVVLPNKRAGVYLRKHLTGICGHGSFLPGILTINEFIQELSRLAIADDVTLLFELFETFKAVSGDENYSFSSFYHLGEILLRDFEDIDSHLTDTKKLFIDIRAMKEIDNLFEYFSEQQIKALQEFWKSFSKENLSKHQQKFIALWNIVPHIYAQYKKKLLSKNIAYQGLIFRHLHELMTNNKFPRTTFQTIYFVGFNILTTGEIRLFDYFNHQGKAKFFWDYDEYYISDKNQEAGIFLRKNLKRYKASTVNPELPSNLKSTDKQIEVYKCPSRLIQLKLISEKLQHMPADKKMSGHRAIILPDENLLLPVLGSIPDNFEKLNVTMGYPVRQTLIFALVSHFIQLQSRQKNPDGFYFKHLISLLEHPYIKNLLDEKAKELPSQLIKNHQTIVSYVELQNISDPFLTDYCIKLSYPLQLLEHLESLLKNIYAQSQQNVDINKIEKETLKKTLGILSGLKNILTKYQHQAEIDVEILGDIILSMVSQTRVPFVGEPLEDLQVLGLLETRNLDFDTIFIPCMNEGLFPGVERPPSFINETLRMAFDLPVIRHLDALYAYLFYRVIQRAKKIYLYYSSGTSQEYGEISRYVRQLLIESGLPVHQSTYQETFAPAFNKEIEIPKSGNVMKILNKFLHNDGPDQKYISASALNSYLDCPLQFYFRYVAKFPEQEDKGDEFPPWLFGQIFHDTMEELYSLHQNTEFDTVDKKALYNMKAKVEDIIKSGFIKNCRKHATGDFHFRGEDLIIKEIIKKQVINTLQIDEKIAPFRIVSLENTYLLPISTDINNKSIQIAVKAIIDRIDSIDGTYRIIDYKTGKAEKKFRSVEALFDKDNTARNKPVFQILLYSLIYHKLKKIAVETGIVPGIYNFADLNTPDFDPYIYQKTGKNAEKLQGEMFSAILSEFDSKLRGLLKEIFNPSIPFNQTGNIQICERCSYNIICQR